MTVRLTNRFPEIERELPRVMTTVLRRGAEMIAEAAKERVPVGPAKPHLRDAIHVEPNGDAYEVLAGDEKVFWGQFVEFGSVNNNPPKPFLVPAAEAKKHELETLGNEALKRL